MLVSMNDEDKEYALTALAAIGLGVAAYAVLTSATRRRAFKQAIRYAVESHGAGFVEANLARIDGTPIWLVTLNHPWQGIAKHRLSFPADVDPYSKEVLNSVIASLVNAIRRKQSQR